MFRQFEERRCQCGGTAPILQGGVGGVLLVFVDGRKAVFESGMDEFGNVEFAETVDVGAETKTIGQSIVGLFEEQDLSFENGAGKPCDLRGVVKGFAADDDGFIEIWSRICSQWYKL